MAASPAPKASFEHEADAAMHVAKFSGEKLVIVSPLPQRPGMVEVPKVVTEYPMPGAMQTHEMAVVGDDLLVVSQQTNSSLVKVELDPVTGRPLSCIAFRVGDFWAGLHGLAASREYPGQVWATLQFQSTLIRLSLPAGKHPVVEQVISLPHFVNGPHCILENGNDLWTSCKDSGHVVRVNHRHPLSSDAVSVYPCHSRRPIFVAIHPKSGDVYASLDESSKIWRLESHSGKVSEEDIPASKGSIPVGMIAGPDGNVWFVLLGGASGGTGTFGRISETNKIEWFHLSTPAGANAGLIHLAFDWDWQDPKSLRMWLLGSSLLSQRTGADAVFTVQMDGDRRVTSQHTITLATPLCFTHRILPHRTGLFVTELGVSAVAYVAGAAALHPSAADGETTDVYADFGMGKSLSHYRFVEKLHAPRSLAFAPAVLNLASQVVASTAGRKRTAEEAMNHDTDGSEPPRKQ